MTRKSDIALELLAPARDYRHGKTAIDSGADAVYIGAPAFGARAAASASLDEIADASIASRKSLRLTVAKL